MPNKNETFSPALPKLSKWAFLTTLGSIAVFPGLAVLIRVLVHNPPESVRALITALMGAPVMFVISGLTLFFVSTDPKEFCFTKWNRTVNLLFGTWFMLLVFSTLAGYHFAGPWFFPSHAVICLLSILPFIPLYTYRKYYLQHPDG